MVEREAIDSRMAVQPRCCALSVTSHVSLQISNPPPGRIELPLGDYVGCDSRVTSIPSQESSVFFCDVVDGQAVHFCSRQGNTLQLQGIASHIFDSRGTLKL